MANPAKKAQVEQPDDDWEQVEPSRPDDAISLHSESETIANDQSYVEVDDPKKTKYPGRIYQSPDSQPQGPLPTLRRSLYTLKDTLKESIEQLNDFGESATIEALAISGPLAIAQRRQVDGLNVLLTNCASDWDKSASSGGMSFDEFADIDPVSVDALGKIFRDFVEDVRFHKYKRPTAVEADDDEDTDITFLDLILPAVHEVDTLLRIEADDQELTKLVQHWNEEAGTAAASQHQMTAAIGQHQGAQAGSSDRKVHEQMMIVSDW